MAEEVKESVYDILGDFKGMESAKELFSELGYDRAKDPLSRRDWSKAATEALV
jgi:hypothetical protein